MEPAGILALTSTCVNLTYRLGTLAQKLYSIGQRYKTVEWSVQLVGSQLAALSAAVRVLNEWLRTAHAESRELQEEIKQSLSSCDALVQFILDQVSEWQAKSDKMSLWSRTKYLWDEATIMRFEGMLRGQVQALSLLLQVKDITSSSEQIAFLRDKRASTVLHRARDDTSSLLWLRDAESTRTTTSVMTDNLEAIDVEFDFDELVVASKAYRSTLAGFLKRKIVRDNKAKNRSALVMEADQPAPGQNLRQPLGPTRNAQKIVRDDERTSGLPFVFGQDQELLNQAIPHVPQQPLIRRKPVAIDTRKPLPSRPDTSTPIGEVSPADKAVEESIEFSSDVTLNKDKNQVEKLVIDQPSELVVSAGRALKASVTSETKCDSVTTTGSKPIVMSGHKFDSMLQDEGIDTEFDHVSTELQGEHIDPESDLESDEDLFDYISSSPSIDDEDIDFEFVYAMHTFVATVEGQLSINKGDTLVLLDDSNEYWWLLRSIAMEYIGHIGYVPAEHIELPVERLARLNKHRNVDLSCTMLGDLPYPHSKSTPQCRRPSLLVRFSEEAPLFIEPNEYDSPESDEDTPAIDMTFCFEQTGEQIS